MIRYARLALFAACTFFLSVSPSRADLIDRGGGLIYDTVLDITWLQDANYASTTGAAPWGGVLTWADAMNWVSGLEYFDSERGITWDDWRLPTTVNDPSSDGWDTTGQNSELGYNYYVNLGYLANESFNTSDPSPTSDNYNPFINLKYRGYFSQTLNPFGGAWYTHFHFGNTGVTSTLDMQYVWAVRDGDVANPGGGAEVAVAGVPEPTSLGLVGLGLAGAAFVRRRKKTTTD